MFAFCHAHQDNSHPISMMLYAMFKLLPMALVSKNDVSYIELAFVFNICPGTGEIGQL